VTTYFASPEKADKEELKEEIEMVSHNPIITSLLRSVSGLLAVLDEHRQIIALNDSFLRMLGIPDPASVLGLRPGEALQCAHAHDMPAGCGTTLFCPTCGVAIAIVAGLGEENPAERICALSVNREGKTVDITLLVRSHPITIDNKKFLLLFLQDISREQQRAALERTFFHDINNLLGILLGLSEQLNEENPSHYSHYILNTALRLQNEVAIQRSLMQGESFSYQPMWHTYSTTRIVRELEAFFTSHPVAQNKILDFSENHPDIIIKTDISLLLRVLCNMIINALEATSENYPVKIWLEQEGSSLSFCVWNRQEIPEHIARRIFQRNFSTKKQDGRGIGTYSMRLFGENILGGRVSFSTSKEEGTVFKFTCPVSKIKV
jgi:K+-sensing histidine kinase KdpD